ncbi:MAG: FAD-dependent 5-carboxymethylaminomethyl-2-thiouridine(34) oxidoreductase MnmC [Hyphomonadaceae bacterium]|nr:FAD-dependent 5-carboxymethylaminomethyl-2-thiouridine(34) oxidoreductase MnmC [Hyphomonadaceae bacterium]
MSRLPPAPDLEWKPDGTPVARGFGDVYFSTADGLEETRAVFLKGCGLPERWAGRETFLVAETGFGTGLNFLALWQLWRAHRPSPTARLHFVSFEGFPLHREDAARALSAWPELAGLSTRLLARWPHRARGVRRLDWPEDGLTLTLHVDEISRALPASRFTADAWFLDGFSPSRNEAMWGDALYPEIAARSASGAVAASFTVARAVRDGLSAAGFEVSKQPGFGRKRDRLEAVFRGQPEWRPDLYGLRCARTPPGRIAISGAGIAGASIAHALARRGADVTLFDPNGAASGASGNPLGLVMPRIDAGDTVTARLLLDAYIAARVAYQGFDGAEETEVRQPPRDAAERERFAKILADPPLPLEDLEALADGGLLHKRALIVRPPRLIASLIRDVRLVERDPEPDELGTFDTQIITTGAAMSGLLTWAGMVGKLGQVDYVKGLSDAPNSAIASGHYALCSGTDRLWGATFETSKGDPQTSPDAQARNAEALASLSPWWRAQIRGQTIQSRAGIRATTPDRLPLAGAVPDGVAFLDRFESLRNGQEARMDAPLFSSLYAIGGLGSRGFTFAPWLADIVAAQICGEPAPATEPALEAVSPVRFLRRALKRGKA